MLHQLSPESVKYVLYKELESYYYLPYMLMVDKLLSKLSKYLCYKTSASHPRYRAHNRLKYMYHISTVNKTVSFIGVIYRNTGESLLPGEQMIQKQLHHQSPPQDWQQHENFGNLEHFSGSSTYRTESACQGTQSIYIYFT